MPILKLEDKDYRSRPGLSQSTINQALIMSPFEWLRRQNEPFEPTPKMKLGTLIHAMVFEPETIEREFVKVPKLDRRRTESKELLAALEKDSRTQIDEETWSLAESVTSEIADTKAANLLFTGGKSEVSVLGHSILGEPVKGKIDYLREDARIILDLKTTEQDLQDDNLRWLMDQKSYKVQAAFYIDLLKMETGEDYSFCFFFVNVKAPFEMRKVVVSDSLNSEWIDDGRALYLKGLESIISWRKEDKYPKLIDLPSYIPQSWRKNK